MSKDLHDYRKSYEKGTLTLEGVRENPFQQFKDWFDEADASGLVEEVNAMTLSTLGLDGFPRGRVVLLKEFSEKGFVFFTNYNSEKGASIAKNKQVSLSFFWQTLERQISIQGEAEKISEEQSVTYFSKRPRQSQLGAVVSDQSEPIENREALEAKLKALEKQFEGQDIPKPKNWGGYLVKPVSFEFWQGRRSRLHDRIQYTKKEENWLIQRLQP
ncbi:pyridoxamine 5'-phosphate oxidase [Marinirhabdus gelatinilytica]|uniref:Pyridoxine/pyridoxamine 5'-phosphate oxidase n=1 Tax=Marinirhabdus gelatinilytica TaxID=1703343 RepID=A0A370QAK5_9FLAO|nr:pyridoxamine 5'-phosphate oxidase [Marinirhabdus gelatinilytica]RDK85319.1 pyridoxamine 5'-phosphate oxidase [Marinirhabdus gelatinilytica]